MFFRQSVAVIAAGLVFLPLALGLGGARQGAPGGPPRAAARARLAESPPTPLLYSSAPDYPDAGLQSILDRYLADAPGHWAAVVKKLDTGQYATVGADTRVVTASLYKLFVVYEVMYQRILGTLSLDEALPITGANAAYDRSIGELRWTVGSRIKIARLVEQMIVVSDNTAALTLANRVGIETINASLQRLGLTHTRLDFGSGDNLSTAAEYSRLLEWIATGQVLDRDSCRYILDVLLRQQLNDLLPQGVRTEIPVAHKTGTLEGLRHDAGIVYGASGPYVISVLGWDLSNPSMAYRIMPYLSKAVYEYFNGHDFQPARYFPETRQVVGPAFLLFYNSNGGPATFGLPIGPETTQGEQVVQYFERARMERPTDGIVVTLGAVGREVATAQGRPFPAVDHADPADPNTLWFPATHQALTQPFLNYWRQHGGEALFGAPLGPIQIEQHNGEPVRVQYFERARLELHEDTIQLGALGTELYAPSR